MLRSSDFLPLAAARLNSEKSFCAALLRLMVLPTAARAEGFDTEHIFAFMIGVDVGEVGEHELQSETTGRFGKDSGTYQALGQDLSFERHQAKLVFGVNF